MSKLYDVISRLEDIAAKDETQMATAEQPFQQASAKKKSPWLRIAVLSSIAITAGFLVIALTMWWKSQLLVESPDSNVVQQPPVLLPEDSAAKPPAIPDGESSHLEELNNNSFRVEEESPQLTVIPPPSQEKVEENDVIILQPKTIKRTVSAPGLQLITEENQSIPMGQQSHSVPDVREMEQQQSDTVIEPKPLALVTIAKEPVKEQVVDNTFKLKQWLYQAEQLRKHGQWQGAATLFTQIWDISKQPEVGNNLAACLIELDQLDEAKTVLKHALSHSPTDRDLSANLKLVEKMLQD